MFTDAMRKSARGGTVARPWLVARLSAVMAYLFSTQATMTWMYTHSSYECNATFYLYFDLLQSDCAYLLCNTCFDDEILCSIFSFPKNLTALTLIIQYCNIVLTTENGNPILFLSLEEKRQVMAGSFTFTI